MMFELSTRKVPRAEGYIDIQQLFQLCYDKNASDLHLVKGEPPILRVYGGLVRTEYPVLNDALLEELVLGLLTDRQRRIFEQYNDIDVGVTVPGIGRFRVNAHRDRGSIGAALRRLPLVAPKLNALGLPTAATALISKANGLVLVTGPVGSGKSTTLAAMVDQINHERSCLVVTIEDPIEFLHVNKKSVIKQREVPGDTPTFAAGLKYALRQDPNVIVVGEMRDLETIATALTAAETGHLVLATLHTPDAAQTVERIINVFPGEQQRQIRVQLANSLQGIIAQLLLPNVTGQGMVLACELLINTPGVRNLIRDQQTAQLPTLLQTGGKIWMQTMDSSLKSLVKQRLITQETALAKVRYPEDFASL